MIGSQRYCLSLIVPETAVGVAAPTENVVVLVDPAGKAPTYADLNEFAGIFDEDWRGGVPPFSCTQFAYAAAPPTCYMTFQGYGACMRLIGRYLLEAEITGDWRWDRSALGGAVAKVAVGVVAPAKCTSVVSDHTHRISPHRNIDKDAVEGNKSRGSLKI